MTVENAVRNVNNCHMLNSNTKMCINNTIFVCHLPANLTVQLNHTTGGRAHQLNVLTRAVKLTR